MNKKLLLIEDDADALHFYESWFTGKGFTVYPLQNAKKALSRFHKIQPACVVLDIVLPGRSGVETARDIRRTVGGKQAAIILITGVYKNVRNRLDAQTRAGADDCLFKPFLMEDLLASLENACCKRSGSARISPPMEREERGLQQDRPPGMQKYRDKEAGKISFLRGKEYFAAGLFAAAARCFKEAIALDRKAEYIFYLAFAVERLGDKHWRQEAEAGYRASLALNPYHAAAYFRLGRLLHYQARNAEAEENYRLALALKPDYNEAARALQRMTGAGKKKKKRLGFFT